MVLEKLSHWKGRLILSIFNTQLQKENSPRRSGSFLCSQKEDNPHPFPHQGGLRAPRPVSIWPCADTDSIPFEDRPLSKLKESDRCSASENLYLDALSLDDEPEDPPPLRNCLAEVSQGLCSEVPNSRRGLSSAAASVWQMPLPASSPDNLCLEPSDSLPMETVLFGGPDPTPVVSLT